MVRVITAQFPLLLLAWVFLQDCRTFGARPCQNTCGGITVHYPFGTTKHCGNPKFEPYVNCTDDELWFYAPTGSYPITAIDYRNNILVIEDSSASTCSQMRSSRSFGLPVNSPFAIASATTFVLLACSPFAATPPTLCDSSLAALQICSALYGCSSSVPGVGLAPGSSDNSSCCVYAANQYPVSLIDLPFLQCGSYASVYSFGPAGGYSLHGVKDYSFQNPSSWSYGIALSYYYDWGGGNEYDACSICQQSNGICSFNAYGFVCICGSDFNSSDRCSYDADLYANGGSLAGYRLGYLFLFGGLSLLLGIISCLL